MADSMETSLSKLYIDPSKAGSSGHDIAGLRPAEEALASFNSSDDKLHSVGLPSRQSFEAPMTFQCNTNLLDQTFWGEMEMKQRCMTAVVNGEPLNWIVGGSSSSNTSSSSSSGVPHLPSPSSIASSAESTDSSLNSKNTSRNSTPELDADAELLPSTVKEAFKNMSLRGRRPLRLTKLFKGSAPGRPQKFASRDLHRVAGKIVNRCKVCTFKSRSLDDFNQHIEDYHSPASIRCSRCSFCSADKSVISQHRLKHHYPGETNCGGCVYCTVNVARKSAPAGMRVKYIERS